MTRFKAIKIVKSEDFIKKFNAKWFMLQLEAI